MCEIIQGNQYIDLWGRSIYSEHRVRTWDWENLTDLYRFASYTWEIDDISREPYSYRSLHPPVKNRTYKLFLAAVCVHYHFIIMFQPRHLMLYITVCTSNIIMKVFLSIKFIVIVMKHNSRI